ncbi:MAG: hypothetical protein ACTS73_06580 [Arsenophonus sp. NEOnobi-MAG3]
MIPLIKPLMFCWQDFQRTCFSDEEEARERLRITASILQLSVSTFSFNKNDQSN